MLLYTHKQALKSLALICMLVSFATKAQINDTVPLDEVIVKTSRINYSAIGKKIQKLDSLTLLLFKNQSLDVLLSNNTPIFVKNYGSGASKTTTFRGGNASQTAILWNGLNIQNSMLGQTDLSNIAGNLFNSVDIEYGGASTLWGSGAMAGAVHLNNTHQVNKGLSASLNNMISSIGLRSASSNINYSNSKISFDIKGMIVDCANNYSFYKDSITKVKQTQAYYNQLSALPELKWFVNKNNSVQASVWLSKGLRNIPNNLSSIRNKLEQKDEAQRTNLNWTFSNNKLVNYLRASYFFELLNYTDSVAKLNSIAKMETRIIEDEIYFKWNKDHTLNFGFNYTKNEARTNNFNGTRFIERYAFVLAHKDNILRNKLASNVAIRYEHTSNGLDPITYNIGVDYIPTHQVTLKLNAGKVYRIPTLNDLYWIPGGNLSLKPEHGNTIDGAAEYSRNFKNVTLVVSGSAFYKLINDWIQWIPAGGGISKPVNLQQVYSRGTETSWHLAYNKNKFGLQLRCITSYVLSTINKTILEGDETLNKQLIYTPRYTVNSSLIIHYGTLAVSYFHNYIGYRFTASDNSAWIDPYHYSTVRTSYSYSYKKLGFNFFANINNVLNVNYIVVKNYPQPLRYFEIGIQLNYKHKTLNK